jgi:polyphenol oxidase
LWRNVKNFAYLRQVHKADVLVLDENTQYQPNLEYDAVITNRRILIPIVYVADCVPIIVCDEKKEVF